MITPGQFEIPGQTPITDPLQLQFMTQGQMGYMPQAQFLTPYQYGNFRTMPTPDVMGYASQETGIIQNYLIANRGSDPFGILPAYTFNTYNPAINARQQQVVAQRRMEDARAAWAPLAADLGINIGMGVFGGIPGMVASMLMPDWLSPSEMVAQRRKSTREIQNLSTSKIFTGPDRDEAYGLGFGYKQARNLDRFIRENAADDTLLKEGDWRDMLQLGMKYGQFDYANSAEQYKRILKNMRGNMTTMMEVIGSTDFEEIMKNMKRMQDMGAQQQHYMNIARKEQQYARVTGLSHQEMVDTYGQSGALTFQQAGLNAMQGSMTAMSNAALATYLQRTGAIDPTLMAHFGGVSGMAQQMTQASAKAHRTIQDTLLAGMMNDDFTGLAEGLDLVSIVNDPQGMDKLLAGAGRVNTIGKQRRFNVNRHKAYADLQEKYGPEVVEALMAKMAGQRLTGSDGDDAIYYGYQALGYSSEEAETRLAMIKSGGIWEMSKQAREEQRRKAREEREQRNSPLNKIGRWFEGMKEWLGQGVYSVAEKLTPTSNAKSDAQAGKASSGQLGTSGQASGHEADAYGMVRHPNIDLSSMSKSDQEAARYFIEHPDEINALTSYFETGKIGGTKGMNSTGLDSDGGVVFGKYQTNSKQKSLQEWMEKMYYKTDERGNPLGQEIVKNILKAGGVTDFSNIHNAIFNANWYDERMWRAYEDEVSKHDVFMEESQRSYINDKVRDARRLIGQQKNGREILELVDSDPRLQALLYDTTTQHGQAGAKNVFVDAYRPGINKRDFTSNVFLVSRPKFHKNGQSELQNRYIRENAIYQAGFNADDGIVSDPTGRIGGDQTISSFAARSVKKTNARGVGKVHYGYGVKSGTRAPVGKGAKDKKGRDLTEGLFYSDCSGWVGEELEDLGSEARQNGDWQMYDESVLNFFKNAKGMTAASQLEWFEKNDKLFRDKEIDETFLRAQGVTVIGLDTGVYTEKDRDERPNLVDHVVMSYVDQDTGELMIAESRSGEGVVTTPYKEWITSGSGKKAHHMYAGSITRLARTKDGARNTGANTGIKGLTGAGIDGTVQTAGGGKSQKTAEEDDAIALAAALSRHQLDNTRVVGGGLISRFSGNARAMRDAQHDLAEAGQENYAEAEKRNIEYALGAMNEDRAERGLSNTSFKTEDLDEILRKGGNELLDYRKFANFDNDINSYFHKKGETAIINGNYVHMDADKWDYEGLYENNPYFRMNVQLAERAGYTGEDRYKFALKATQDPTFATMWRERYLANGGYGADTNKLQALKDEINRSGELALEEYNKGTERGMKMTVEATRELLGVGKDSFFSTGEFAEDYGKFTNDAYKGKDVFGQEHLMTRGEYVEQLPAVATILGELENIEKAEKRDAHNPEARERLAERKKQAITALANVLRAYGVEQKEIEEILQKYNYSSFTEKDIKDNNALSKNRITELSKLLGKKAGGMELSEEQQKLMAKWAKKGRDDTSGAYEGDYYGTRLADGTVMEGSHTGEFNKRGEWLESVAKNEILSQRTRATTVETHNLAEQYKNAFNVLAKYGRATEEDIMNFANKEKVGEARAQHILATLRANGMTKTAGYLEEYRKQGVSVKSGLLKAALEEYRSHGHTEEGVSPFIDEYSPDAQQSGAEKTLGGGTGGYPVGGGGLSQGANQALEQLPGVLVNLTNAINNFNASISGGVRKESLQH